MFLLRPNSEPGSDGKWSSSITGPSPSEYFITIIQWHTHIGGFYSFVEWSWHIYSVALDDWPSFLSGYTLHTYWRVLLLCRMKLAYLFCSLGWLAKFSSGYTLHTYWRVLLLCRMKLAYLFCSPGWLAKFSFRIHLAHIYTYLRVCVSVCVCVSYIDIHYRVWHIYN